MKKTINVTLEIEDIDVINFERFLNENLKVISFRIIPDTENLYKNDTNFKKIVDNVKKAQKIRDLYINEKKIGNSFKTVGHEADLNTAKNKNGGLSNH